MSTANPLRARTPNIALVGPTGRDYRRFASVSQPAVGGALGPSGGRVLWETGRWARVSADRRFGRVRRWGVPMPACGEMPGAVPADAGLAMPSAQVIASQHQNRGMPFYLQLAASIVLLVRDGEVSVGGTCFAFRERHNFLTAEHCIPEGAQAIVLQEPNRVQRPALAIERNPAHDVALIRTAPLEDEIGAIQIVDSIPEDIVDDGDFMTYGYLIDEGAGGLVGRLLKGCFQRYFGYQNIRGHTYFAGEMSIATPAGHSGGLSSALPPHNVSRGS